MINPLVFGELPPPPPIPKEILQPFLKANQAFPQMYGVMIIRVGRVAMDMMIAGRLTMDHFSQTQADKAQKTTLLEAAITAHKRAGVDVPYSRKDMGFELVEERLVTPFATQGIYTRTRRGILETIRNHGWLTLDLPEDELSLSRNAERRYIGQQLLERPENRASALLLQEIWQTADNAISGRTAARTTADLHTALSSLPPYEDVGACRAAIGKARQAAQIALSALLVPALEPLKQHASTVLGSSVMAHDVVDSFPLYALYEGNETAVYS